MNSPPGQDSISTPENPLKPQKQGVIRKVAIVAGAFGKAASSPHERSDMREP
jgi:hypothetical protein